MATTPPVVLALSAPLRGGRALKAFSARWADSSHSARSYPNSPCVIWQGTTNQAGYGVQGRSLAHRVAYEEAYGPIEQGLQIHHVCRRPACVNPAHLEAHTARSHSRQHLPGPAVIDEAVELLARFPRLSPGAIARLTGRNLGSVYTTLARAVEDGLIVRVERGEYVLAEST